MYLTANTEREDTVVDFLLSKDVLKLFVKDLKKLDAKLKLRVHCTGSHKSLVRVISTLFGMQDIFKSNEREARMPIHSFRMRLILFIACSSNNPNISFVSE